MLEHRPDGWVAPIVSHFLWEDLDLKVIVSTFQHPWTRMNILNINTMHVLSCILESILKGLLVLFGFSFAIGDESVTISDEDENTPFVNSVQGGNVGDGVLVHEYESELPSIEHFIFTLLKEPFNI